MSSEINQGQMVSNWDNFWQLSSPETEIQMWDYYGSRHMILKYVPRFGKVLEAGCGLGRYNFYLTKLGIEIEGLDFSPSVVEGLNQWKNLNGFENCVFVVGDVCNLPYASDSLAGIISLGVVEHFVEGPQKPLEEVFRVLRPGGIAIVTTPAPSWSIILKDKLEFLKNQIRPILNKEKYRPEFFQYWYSAKTLKAFLASVHLNVTRAESRDMLYPYHEFRHFRQLQSSDLFVNILNRLDDYSIAVLGGQSITVSVKEAEKMYCFLCGEMAAKLECLQIFDVPICGDCYSKPNANYYKKGRSVKYNSKMVFNPPIKKSLVKICSYCSSEYPTSPVFENFGFARDVCESCLENQDINIELSNSYIQPIWRKRIK